MRRALGGVRALTKLTAAAPSAQRRTAAARTRLIRPPPAPSPPTRHLFTDTAFHRTYTEMQALKDAEKAQGDLVRKLKADKKTGPELDTALTELKRLKAEIEALVRARGRGAGAARDCSACRAASGPHAHARAQTKKLAAPSPEEERLAVSAAARHAAAVSVHPPAPSALSRTRGTANRRLVRLRRALTPCRHARTPCSASATTS
jgi:hypothetical protein